MKFHSDLRRIKVKPFCWKVQPLPQRARDGLLQELLGNQAALKEEKVGKKREPKSTAKNFISDEGSQDKQKIPMERSIKQHLDKSNKQNKNL